MTRSFNVLVQRHVTADVAFARELIASPTEAREHTQGKSVARCVHVIEARPISRGALAVDARKRRDAMTETRILVRAVLRLLWEADLYPCIGNEDWAVAARMEAAALAKAATAVASPDDPPEFGRWLGALCNGGLTTNEREEIYWAIHDYFGEDERQGAG